MSNLFLTYLLFIFSLVLGIETSCAQTIGIFSSPQIPQHQFAANKVKKAFESKGFNVELLNIKDLTADYPEQKVVITLTSDQTTLGFFEKANGNTIGNLGEQSFAIRTTQELLKSYWIFGGDANGGMYGGLQLEENINLYGSANSFNEEQSPDILKRGIKFNIPFDKRSPTYYSSGFSEDDFRGTSTKMAVEHVWNLDFWSTMFDELARDRYNALSLWTLHPFTSMIKLSRYPDAAIQNIEGFDGFSKTLSIDGKIDFWKKVMTLAKNRGLDFYIYNWNIYTYGATGKYGINNDPRNPKTKQYMRNCIIKLFETYPDLTGFGITAGENMKPLSNEEEAQWTWATYGKGIMDYAKLNPERDIQFIFRYHDAGGAEVVQNFKSLFELPNVQFDFSFKYAVAHIYSTTKPEWIRTRNGDVPAQLLDLNLQTWIELRNDSFYYLHWGDPDFVKEYLAGFPEKERIVKGFFMGSDGYTPTYVFTGKADWSKDKLEIDRTWYTWMLWGRLAFNPSLKEDFFQKMLKFKYPKSDSKTLFKAWSEASKGIPLFTETIQGTLISDFKWYPETCMSRRYGFVTIDQIAEAVPPPGSNVCSIGQSAVDNCENKKSTYDVASEIEAHATNALNAIGNREKSLNTELGTNMGNIQAMSYLSLYFSEKLRGATYKVASQNEKAMNAMGRAYRYWIKYSALMDSMYTGQDLQRTKPITTFKALNDEVLEEYIKLGGSSETMDGKRQ